MNEAEPLGVIWDLDGTLVDTAEQHYQAWVELCRQRNFPFRRADFSATFGWRNPEIVHKLFGTHFTEKEIADIGEQKETYYREAARHGVQLLPGAGRLLAELRGDGFRQAIGSSAPRANVDLLLSVTKTSDFFAAMATAEDTTKGKPDPQVFLMAANKLQLPPSRCLVVEDAVVGVQAARAAGMKCVAVYFAGHHPEATLRAAGADLVVSTLEDVRAADIRRLLSQS